MDRYRADHAHHCFGEKIGERRRGGQKDRERGKEENEEKGWERKKRRRRTEEGSRSRGKALLFLLKLSS